MAIDGKGRPTKEQAESKRLFNSWTRCIADYSREFKEWESRVEKIIKRYRDDRGIHASSNTRARFNILWSNVQTLVPATFSRLPQPDVSRRFRDNDPVGRVASLILERALDFEINHYADYRATMKQSVTDRFLGGRGTCWARYEPHIRAAAQGLPVDGDEVSEDVDAPGEELDYECAPVDYVHYKDFGHSVARTWEEVTRVWRKVYMTRDACIKRFGDDVGNKIPLDSSPKDKNSASNVESQAHQLALVIEGWDKETKKAVWISKSLGIVLDTVDDPLGLEGFFPCPRPLFATTTNDTLIPIPDFVLYQDQAMELDRLCDRIDGLIKALQVKGVYNAEFPAIARIFTEASNTQMIPVKDWSAFAEKAGLSGALEMVDLKPIYEALMRCYEAMEQVKQQVYDITGISDIVRGASKAQETATAQRIKGQYATLRLKSNQDEVAEYATECLRMKAQIMCNKFDPQTMMRISAVDQLSEEDQKMVPQAMQLLMGPRAMNPELEGENSANPLRSFRIDIAADTLVQMDEEAEKESRVEFLTAVGAYLEKALPVVQAAPDAGSLVIDLLKFGVTGFKVGKQIEGSIDEALDRMRAVAKQPKQQQPDPEMMKVQAQQQADAAKLQADQAAEQARMQADMAIERMRSQIQQDSDRQKAVYEFQLEQQRMTNEQAFARFEAMLKAKTAIEVAEIGADATLEAGQIAAANQGTQQ